LSVQTLYNLVPKEALVLEYAVDKQGALSLVQSLDGTKGAAAHVSGAFPLNGRLLIGSYSAGIGYIATLPLDDDQPSRRTAG